MIEKVNDKEGLRFFLNEPQKLDNPFPDLKYFRENRHIFYHKPLNEWFIFRYDDVATLFHDSRLSSDRMKGFVDAAPQEVRDELRKIAAFLEKWVLMKDGQDHSRIRNFLHLGFNATVIHGLAENIQQSADELLSKVQGRGYFDACEDFAFLLPAYVLSDLLGVHREDRNRVVQWSVDFVDFFNVIPITVETTNRMVKSCFEMMDYTKNLLAEREANPKDDFLGTLVKAETFENGLLEDEIIGNVMLLLLAGHVAVRNLIGNAIYLLLTHPEQLAMLKAEPSLLTNVIEETLRYEPPVTMIPRIAIEDFEFHGNLIKKGQIVQLSIVSANRDEAHFPDGDRFDISRKPGKHLGFGIGPHGCLGASLAKEEAHIALETLFRRMPGIRLDESKKITWYRNAGNRGPINLPLVF
jgi:cytochrome P450